MNRKTLRLPDSFIAFAKSFSIRPVELAERVLEKIAKQRNRKFTVIRKRAR